MATVQGETFVVRCMMCQHLSFFADTGKSNRFGLDFAEHCPECGEPARRVLPDKVALVVTKGATP